MSVYDQPMHMLPPFTVKTYVQILSEVLDYNHQLMNIPAMWTKTMGQRVAVAILDTGLPSHPDLTPTGSKSFVSGYLADANGHSTHVGGIIAATANNGMGVAGIAPLCDDYYVAVLDGSGSGSIDAIISGIYYAVDKIGAHVINMSLGIPAGVPRMRKLEEACNYAHDQGVTVVAAAGNEAGDVGQPAEYDSVIAVAAVNNRQEHAAFSDAGPQVDFAAGGVDVFSTYLNRGYAKLSGTSMASPALAGVAALIISEELVTTGRKLSPDEVKAKLRKIAFDVGPAGFDELYGFGIPVFGQPERPYDPSAPDGFTPPPTKQPKKRICPIRFGAKAGLRSLLDGQFAAVPGRIKAALEYCRKKQKKV